MDRLATSTTQARIRAPAPNAVRITHAPPGGPFPADRPWLAEVLLPAVGVETGESGIRAEVEAGCLRLLTPQGTEILAEARPPVLGRRGRIRLTFRLEPGESFYGLGEWFNAFRRTGGSTRLRIRDAFAFLQGMHTYSAFPFVLSSRGYALLLLNSHTSTWRIDPKRGLLTLEASGPPADYLVIYGPAFREILETYTALTGRPPLVPRWAFGLWATGYPQEHQDVVLERVEEHRRRGIPLDGVILDYHWEERFHNFRWRQSLFPDPAGLISRLQRTGVRLGLILTPFLNTRNLPLQKAVLNRIANDLPRAQKHDDERALPQFEEARSKGILAHERVRWWFGVGGMLDFTNPEAGRWWNNHMHPLYEQGIAFFKNDDGEYLPSEAHSALGIGGDELHNLYGFFYGKALFEGMGALDDRRPFIYARSVWAGSQRFPALFLGDQKPSFECLRRTMRAGLNLSLAGFAYWTADVFGLDGPTTPETHMRYAQWALFVPVARYFWRPPEIDDTRFPWSHGPRVEDSFRRHAQLRYRLLPYYSALGWEAWRTGMPILRPLLLEFQDDHRLIDIWDQVMLGGGLMLAPVVQAGAVRRRIVLPRGQWHDFWSTASHEGDTVIEVDAPMDRLPILVRGGTILPLGPALTHIPDDHRFDRIQLHVWPPYPAQGILFDDDGISRAYQRGAFSITACSAEGDTQRLAVRLGPAEGQFPAQGATREIEFVLHRTAAPRRVRVNGRPAEGWSHAAREERTIIPVPCPVHSETIVEAEF